MINKYVKPLTQPPVLSGFTYGLRHSSETYDWGNGDFCSVFSNVDIYQLRLIRCSHEKSNIWLANHGLRTMGSDPSVPIHDINSFLQGQLYKNTNLKFDGKLRTN